MCASHLFTTYGLGDLSFVCLQAKYEGVKQFRHFNLDLWQLRTTGMPCTPRAGLLATLLWCCYAPSKVFTVRTLVNHAHLFAAHIALITSSSLHMLGTHGRYGFVRVCSAGCTQRPLSLHRSNQRWVLPRQHLLWLVSGNHFFCFFLCCALCLSRVHLRSTLIVSAVVRVRPLRVSSACLAWCVWHVHDVGRAVGVLIDVLCGSSVYVMRPFCVVHVVQVGSATKRFGV